jgi:hypothetical protein
VRAGLGEMERAKRAASKDRGGVKLMYTKLGPKLTNGLPLTLGLVVHRIRPPPVRFAKAGPGRKPDRKPRCEEG